MGGGGAYVQGGGVIVHLTVDIQEGHDQRVGVVGGGGG